ncbi:hypothetical protein BXO88_11030 [Oribacterium sp. C9]|uniref:SMI1/KNR4 family protein n=1 Tax=Oribacterium sp. C9 TaxID=1943579 RepID=UPI00098F42ED|nr:SMI1/KNR4 family protein [Oribacterium sp. C9]OON85782.1 hypothetical protein BXO88_11030 [Oribacterium sp. C9]
MKQIIETINSLPDLLPLKPASDTQITDAELQLRVNFAEEYKDYLSRFGAIIADGIELTGIANAEHRNVVALTKKERVLNPKVPNTMYVIENTCTDGIIIWQDTKGEVYMTQPEKEPQKIADSMAEYISKHK